MDGQVMHAKVCLPSCCPEVPGGTPALLHPVLQIALQPFTVEQTRQYISTAMGGIEVCGGWDFGGVVDGWPGGRTRGVQRG